MIDSFTTEQRSWIMSRVRSKNTKPEIIVRKYLYSIGFRYRLHNPTIPGKPDISNKRKKIAIFVNGCFWHRHNCKNATVPKTNKVYWEKKFKRTVERDREAYDALINKKWNVIILWECDLKNMEKVHKRLNEIIFLNKSE